MFSYVYLGLFFCIIANILVGFNNQSLQGVKWWLKMFALLVKPGSMPPDPNWHIQLAHCKI